MSGDQVGRYIIKEKLGRGGMASVYLAYDPQFERDVALKMLPVGPGYDHDFLERKFVQEAKIIASLEHFAIVPVYDFGNHDGKPFLVMRLMPEGTLKEQLIQGPLPMFEIQLILERIGSALDKAHARNIVHRDVKPTNIFMDEEGLAYLGDFGIARDTTGDQTTSRIGSPRYMAPEMVQGDHLTERTDIYQIGIVLFEMLTGELPFVGDTTEHTMILHLQGEIPRPSDRNQDVPPAIDAVLFKALAKNPDDRFDSAGDLARAYREALEYGIAPAVPQDTTDWGDVASPGGLTNPTQVRNSPATAYPPADSPPAPAPAAITSPPNRNYWLMGLLAAALLMLVCGISVFFLGITGRLPDPFQQPSEPIILVPTRIDDGDQSLEPTEAAEISSPAPTAEGEQDGDLTLAPTVTLDEPAEPTEAVSESIISLVPQALIDRGAGTGRVVYASDSGGNFDLYLTNEAGESSRLLTSDTNEFNPVFSPSGRQIAYHAVEPVNGTWEIYLISASGGIPSNLTDAVSDDSFPQWSPDGTTIAFHSNRSNQFDLYTIEIESKTVERLTSAPVGDFAPTWSPDGAQIAFYRRIAAGRHELFLINRDGSGETQLTDLGAVSQFPVWSPDGSKIAFQSNLNGNWDIYTLDMTTGQTERITNTGFNSFHPDWTPNGEWLVYHSELDSNNRDIFMINIASKENLRLTNTSDQERMPNWQP